MKRSFDISILFVITTTTDEFCGQFSSDWRYKEMYEYMLNRYNIPVDDIHTIQQNYIKRFKIGK